MGCLKILKNELLLLKKNRKGGECVGPCRIKHSNFSNFLEKAEADHLSNSFKMGNHHWKLLFKKSRGEVGIFVVSQNERELDISLIISVANSNRDQDIVLETRGHLFPGGRLGFRSIAPISILKNSANGYVTNRTLRVQVDIRINSTSNEQLSVAASDDAAVIKWSVKDIETMRPGIQFDSKYFVYRDLLWHLTLKRLEKPDGEQFDLLLTLYSSSTTKVKVRFSMLNHLPGRQDKIAAKEFLYEENDKFGVGGILKVQELDEIYGYSREGWITFNVQMEPVALKEEKGLLLGSCCICLVEPSTSALLHGDSCHQCLCHRCAEKIARQLKNESVSCPICRTQVEKVILRCF